MGASEVLDVVIGLVFVWFLLSLAVSAVNEAFAWLTRVRAKQLWQAMARVVDDTVAPQARLRDLVWRVPVGIVDYRPRVEGGDTSALSARRAAATPIAAAETLPDTTQDFLQRLYARLRRSVHDTAGNGWRTRISSIPPATFADAMLSLAEEVVTRSSLAAAAERHGWADVATALASSSLPLHGPVARADLDAALESLDAGRRDALWAEATAMITIDDVEAVVASNPQLAAAVRRVRDAALENRFTVGARQAIEEWFEAEMASLSRFYRRQTRKIAAIVAVVVVFLSSADAVRVVDDLWHDRDLRAVMAAQAGSAAAGGGTLDEACAAAPSTPSTTTAISAAEQRLSCAAELVGRTRRFVGVQPSWVWTEIRQQGDADRFEAGDVPSWLFHRVPGRLITIVALLLGAGFWYDVLRRLVGLRALARRGG